VRYGDCPVNTSVRTAELDAWVGLVRAHSAVVRRFNAELVAAHGLTINDYEVLLHLSRAPEQRMRRVDLAESVLLSPSGITRLLDGLEQCGLVERAACASDRRVTYAVLTEVGAQRLREARETHLAGVRELFSERFEADDLKNLAALLGRLGASATNPERVDRSVQTDARLNRAS
jgi:DNA-binding MarR family transcriptional regulator